MRHLRDINRLTALAVIAAFFIGFLCASSVLAQDAGATAWTNVVGGGDPQIAVYRGSTVFYEFTTVAHSSVIHILSEEARVCLNSDAASAVDSGARVRIRAITTDIAGTAAGSYVMDGAILDGISGSRPCIDEVPRGRMYVEVVTAPTAATAVIAVMGHDGGTAKMLGNDIPFYDRVALGHVFTDSRQWQVINKFGQNTDIDIAGTADVWDCPILGAPALYPWIETATTLFVSSDSDLDAAGFTILVDGVDANWDRQLVTAVLGSDAGTGTTSVQIGGSNDWMAVNSVQNVTTGVGPDGTVGNVYVHDDVDVGGDGVPDDLTKIRGCWLAGFDRSEMMLYAVPRNHSMLFYTWRFGVVAGSGATTKAILMHIILRPFDGVEAVVGTSGVMTVGTGLFNGELPMATMIPGKSRLTTRALQASANDTHVFSAIDMILAPQ